MTNSMDKVGDIVGGLFFMEADWRKLSDLEHEATCKAAIDLIQSQQALIEEMREALEFYTGIHEPALSRPSEGPWGVNSTDFGARARQALEALSQKE